MEGVHDPVTNAVTWPVIDSVGNEIVERTVTVIFPSTTYTDGDFVTNTLYPTYTPINEVIPVTAPPVPKVDPVQDFVPNPAGGGGSPPSKLTKNGGDTERVLNAPQNYSFLVENNSNVPLVDAILSDSTIPAQVQVNGASTGTSAPPVPVTIEYRTNQNSVFQPWPGGSSTGLVNVSVSTGALTLASGEVVTGIRWIYGDTIPVGFTSLAQPAINGTLVSTDRDGNPVQLNDAFTNSARFIASYTDTAGVTTIINLPDDAPTVVIAPRSEPVLGKSISPGGPFYPGDIFTYIITLDNNNGFNSANLVNPVLIDPLPDAVDFVAGSQTYDPGTTGAPAPIFFIDDTTIPGDTLLRWSWNGASAHTFPPDPTKVATITFKVKLNNLASPQTFINTVYVSPEDDNSFCGIPDVNDIDGDGFFTDKLCSKTSPATGLLDVASLETFKGVKGELDTEYSRFPDVGETVPSGTADYKLTVFNPGNVALTDIVIVDVLPYIGDAGVLSGQPRLSEWRPNLNSTIAVPAGVTVYYSTQQMPCLTEYDPADTTNCDWSTSLPTFPQDITDVQAVKFDFGSIVLQPGDTLVLDWKMRAPVGAPENGEVAWNSFGTRASRVDNGNQLLATEPVKVGIRLTAPNADSASIGNFVWRDDNKNGLQDPGEIGLNGIEVILYLDNGDGIADTATDRRIATTLTGFDQNGNPGFYTFPDLDPGDYFLEFVPRPNYTVTAQDTLLNSSDALDSDVDQVTNLTAVTTLSTGEDDPTWDLGLIPVFSSIGDYVWNDYNRDGIQDPGEDPIEGVLVRVLDSLGNLVNYAYTDVNGYYLVDSLLPSLYTVEFVPPATFYPSIEDSTLDDNTNNDMIPFTDTTGRSRVIVLDAGIDTVTIDAGFFQMAQLGDTVFYDVNYNGLQDPSEVGIAGVTVSLYDAVQDTLIATTTTNSDGYYEFDSLFVNFDYVVEFGTPTGYTTTLQNIGTNDSIDSDMDPVTGRSATVTLSPDEFNQTLDAGFYIAPSLGDFVWLDQDADGEQDPLEPGLGGVTVNLIDAVADTVIATTVTAADGSYEFTNLVPGFGYVVEFEIPAGSYASPQDAGAVLDEDDSDADPTTGRTGVITLASDEDNPSIDAGIWEPVSLGNYVWVDENGDGIQDASEPAIPNVPVLLFAVDGLGNLTPAIDADGVAVPTTITTDINGEYNFTNLVPGEYVVQITAPAGYVPTLPQNDDPEDNTNTDSNIDTTLTTPPGVYQSGPVTLTSRGEPINDGDADNNSNLTVDFGLIEPVSLGDYVWLDKDGDGTQNEVGTGLDGVTVELFLVNGSGALVPAIDVDQQPVPSQLTMGGGAYQFDNLPPGDYVVRITPPTGYFATPVNTADPDNDDNNDSNIDGTATGVPAGSFQSAPVTIHVNQEILDGDGNNDNNQSIDFGLVEPMSLGDYVWLDENLDGIQDGTEPGIDGIFVDLLVLDINGNPVQATDVNGDPVLQTTTAGGGAYQFDNLPPGDYIVRFTPPASFAPTLVQEVDPNVDNDDDSNIDGTATPPAGSYDTDVISMVNDQASVIDGDTDNNTNFTVDAGFFQPLSLGNFVWEDLNGDGTQDIGEPGIDGVTVELLVPDGLGGLVQATDFNGNPIASQLTAGGGLYNFTNLLPGTYVVRVTEPAGFDATPVQNATVTDNDNTDSNIDFASTTAPAGTYESAPITIALNNEPTNDGDTDDDSNLTVDFGFVQPLSVGNYIWIDENGDGLQTPGEPPVVNTAVAIFAVDGLGNLVSVIDLDGNPVLSTTTNASGEYNFTNLPPGEYVIQFEAPTGYFPTLPQTPDPDDDNPDDSNIDITRVTSGPNFYQSAPFTLTSGLEPINDGDTDSNTNQSIDFGIIEPVSLGDYVWLDENGDGLQDEVGTGLDGVLVELFYVDGSGNLQPAVDIDNVLVPSTTTAGGGAYAFDNLPPRDYVVRITPPTGYFATPVNTANPNTNDNNDSNIDGTAVGVPAGSFQSAPVSVYINQESGDGDLDDDNNQSIDFGLVEAMSLGDYVWIDTNFNGLQDDGATGLNGVTVDLFVLDINGDPVQAVDVNGNPVAQTTTANNGTNDGAYQFDNLPPGDYIVRFTPPADYIPSATQQADPNVDANDDSNIDGTATPPAGSFETDVIVMVNNDESIIDGDTDANTNFTVDVGFIQPLSLGNFVWQDLNGDGLQTAGEPGIDGVRVDLLVLNGSGVLVPATDIYGTAVPFQNTAGGGLYNFTNLPPGDYVVQVTEPAGFDATPIQNATVNDNDNTDSNIDFASTTAPAGTYQSALVNLALDDEPTNDGDTNNDSNLSVDFGFVQPMTLGNYIWVDENGDGIQDVGEPAVPSVPVVLLVDDGMGGLVTAVDLDGVPQTTTTNASGEYTFDNLAPGEYVVQITPPAGYVPTLPQTLDPEDNVNTDSNIDTTRNTLPGVYQSAPVTLDNNDEPINDGDTDDNTNLSVDFGLIEPVSLGNYVWLDENGDGVQDGSEPGLDGVTVTLFVLDGSGGLIPAIDVNQQPVPSTLTAAGGAYEFTNLPPGDYVVRITPPTGYFATPVNTADPDNNNNTDSNIDGAAVGVPAGSFQSAPITLHVNQEISDGDADDDNNPSVDFGLVEAMSLGDYVWIDTNGNGLQDDGATGLNGVTVDLFVLDINGNPVQAVDVNGNPVAQTTTANDGTNDGAYRFDNLPPGDYIARFTPPATYIPSLVQEADPNVDANNDSNIDGTATPPAGSFDTDVIVMVNNDESITDGDTDANSNLTIDVGFIQTVSLGNFVWEDLNGNGTQDVGEPGLDGVLVELLVDNGTGTFVPATDVTGAAVASQNTSGGGLYNFINLPPGDYVVQVTEPTGFDATPFQNANVNDEDNTDSNIDFSRTTPPGVYQSAPLTLGVDQQPITDGDSDDDSDLSVDFGFVRPMSLGNFIWEDRNADGTQDVGEPGIENATVALLQPDGLGGFTTVTDLDGNTVLPTLTNALGEYNFTNLPPGDYVIQVTPTPDYYATPVNTSDPEDDDNTDSNIFGPGATPGSHVSDLITLVSGMEPTDDGDTDNTSNLTLDMGFFQSVSVGDTIFIDANGDGIQDDFGIAGGDSPLAGALVEIFSTTDNGVTLNPVVDANGSPVGSQTTGPNGYYLFDDLVPGDYVIRVTPPSTTSGYVPTVNGGDPDNNIGNDSNGDPVTSTYVQSAPVTLHSNTEDQDNDGDDNLNSTVDFGFYEGLSIGDLVWLDSDINGRQDTVGSAGGAEVPLSGFEMILYVEDPNAPGSFIRATDRNGNLVPTQFTGPNGNYEFGNLAPGNYVVEVIPPAGSDYLPTPVNQADPNTDLNDDSNIAQEFTPGVYRSGVIELRDNDEPTDDGDGVDGNKSIDFGFFTPVSLGNRVWLDLNADGIQDPTEVGIDGVTLTLQVFDPAANGGAGGYVDAVDVTGTPIPAQVTTGGGFYEFTNLPPGEYIVTMPASNWDATGPFGPNGLYESALGTATQGGDDQDNTDDNGGRDFELPDPNDPLDPGITSTPIRLVANDEPINDGDTDPNSDLSVDFGVTQPFSIGNQIWFDTNNDGINDIAEAGVDGVLVELWEPDGLGGFQQVGTTQTTAGGGYYLFSKLPPGDYTVVLPASNFAAGGPLEGYYSSGTSILNDGTNDEPTAVDPDNDVDNDDNGTLTLAGPFPGAVVSAPVTLGVNPFEPTSDNDTTPPGVTDPAPDFLTNYTVDFGFYTTSLGNLVWEDQNNNGVRDAGEPAIDGVLVELLSADGLTVLDTYTTGLNGQYLFEDLPEGDYQIRLTPPAGFVSSTGTNGQPLGPYEPAVDPNTVDVNNDDNGTQGAGANAGFVLSPIITQDAGNEHDVNLATGSSVDRRVDFGLFEPLNIGNRVFLDDDGISNSTSTSNNGMQDLNEPGIAGVALTLYLDANGDGIPDTPGSPIARDTTDANGYYMFDYLIEGTYVIGIDANNFATGQPLDTLFSSTISDPTPNNDEDLDDNGIDDPDYATNGIFSGPITLVDDMEPTNDADKGPEGDGLADDNNSNLSVDFGFVAPATYGDYVWEDLNQDGIQDNNEMGVQGIVVTLYEFDPVNMTILRVVGTDTTDVDGMYLFDELAPNRTYFASYSNLPAGYVVTDQSASPNDSIDSDVNKLSLTNTPTHLAPGEDDMTWDLGIYLPLASVGDYVWIDLDKDGYQEAGEPPVAGVMVILYDANGTPVDTTYTDANGRYLFEDVQPGDYYIEFAALPAGFGDYVFSPANQNPNDAGDSDADPVTGRTAVFTLDPGEFDPNWDAGIYLPTASLGDRVWYDTNNDGIQDANEAGVPNVKVVLYDGNGVKVDSTITDAQGYYMFDELTPGDYVVQFTNIPAGYSLTDDGQGTDGSKDSDADPNTGFTATITLGPDENNPDIDAGIYRPLASIGDRVWEDLNEDGIQDPGEPGVGGVTVVLSDANGLPVGQTTTDPSGNYSFTNLVPGDYSVTFSNLPTGYQLTTQDVGLNDSLDSDADPVTGKTILTTLVGGQNDPTWDAGIFQPKASLGDYVWEDDNENGIQDGGETGVAGVKVILFDGNGTKLDSTTTDANGFYLFDMLDPGDYYVQFKDIPTDYIFSPKDVATNNADDSDADVNTGTTAPVTLSAGQDYRDLDAGIYLPKASLGDRVWNDLDNDGIQDTGETGVSGVKVVLYDANGNRIDSTITNINGNYLFDDLTPGTYSVGFEMTPLGSTFSPQHTGGATDDSNADPITGITAPVTLAPGEDNRDVDAGIYKPLASLGNYVWNDYNEDGIQDSNEPGVAGVKVILLDGAGNKLDSTVTDSQGAYNFTGLTPGTYAVQFTDLPADFVFTGKDQGNDQLDSDADPVTGNTATVTLVAGQNYPDLDAGIYQPKAALGDKVWLDLDQDGEQDANEPGVPNVKVVLYDGNGTAIDSVLTDANGNYLFTDLVPGDYVVQFKDLPADHGFSPQDNANDADDSDANQQGFTATVTLGPGETNLTVDAGIIPPTASLGNYVWYDLDEDGIQDANEPPVGGIQVVLNDGNGNPIDTTYTDVDGSYLFENLPAGDYIVSFPNIPTGYHITDPGQGGDNTMDSDVNPFTGQTGVITLLPGEDKIADSDLGISPDCVTDCSAEAYMSGGFAMLFTSGSYPGTDNRWVFDAAGGSFKTYVDGTARLSGTLVNASNSSLTYDMNLRLVNVKDWGQWTADGGQVKGANNGPFMTWDFFEVDSLNSYLIGMGDTLWLSHMPVSRAYGFQLGDGANDKNSDYGLGGWWFFNSTSGNYAGTGDFNVTLDCQAGCGAPVPVPAQLGAMAILQGPYDPTIGKMRTDLRQQGVLPTAQPFNRAPWNYSGTETLGTLAPDSIVDWILVEMRDVNDQTIVLSTQAGLLLKGGEIVQPDGHSLIQIPQQLQSFYLVIHNWNHLAVMSAAPVQKYGKVFYHDFSQANGIYNDPNNPNPAAVNISGTTLLYQGDATGDAQINSLDLGQVMLNYFSSGSNATDINLDGVVNSLDIGRSMQNYFKQSHVPE